MAALRGAITGNEIPCSQDLAERVEAAQRSEIRHYIYAVLGVTPAALDTELPEQTDYRGPQRPFV